VLFRSELAGAQDPAAVPGAFATEAQLESGTPSSEADSDAAPAADGQPAEGQAGAPPRPAGGQPSVLTFPGSQGSRKHKKHRRKHH
jgi:hypothetical protein